MLYTILQNGYSIETLISPMAGSLIYYFTNGIYLVFCFQVLKTIGKYLIVYPADKLISGYTIF